MTRRVNMATAIVQRAQALYPTILDAAVEHIGTNPGYGKERIDRRTADKQIVRMPPEQMANLAQTDPQTYMDAQQRLSVLREKAASAPPLPAADAFEEK